MMGHENGTAAGRVGHRSSKNPLSRCPTPRKVGQMGHPAEGSEDPRSGTRGTGQTSAVELALRVLALEPGAAPRSPGRELARPCLGCLAVECAEGVLFHDDACFEAWKARREERRRARRTA